MTIKEVVLDKNKIYPTDYPRLTSSLDLGKAKGLTDIDFAGVILDDIGDGNLYVRQGHHRIGRALEIALGETIEVDVIEANDQIKRDIYATRKKFEYLGELQDFDDYINKMRWYRREI